MRALARSLRLQFLRSRLTSRKRFALPLPNRSGVLTSTLKGAYACILLASLVGDPACASAPRETFDVNYVASKLVCVACQHANVSRLVFASSCSVYGATSGEEVLDESSGMNPVSLYAVSIVCALRVCALRVTIHSASVAAKSSSAQLPTDHAPSVVPSLPSHTPSHPTPSHPTPTLPGIQDRVGAFLPAARQRALPPDHDAHVHPPRKVRPPALRPRR